MPDLTREQVLSGAKKGARLDRIDLRGLDLSGSELEGLNFRRSELDGSILQNARLAGADLSNASLVEAFLVEADLSQANLEKSELECANLKGAKLGGARLVRANLGGANLEMAQMTKALLAFAQLDGANLGKAVLDGADLSRADLVECYLGGVRFHGSIMAGSTLKRANLEESDLTGADLSDADLSEAVAISTKFVGACLKNAELSNADLSFADLSGTDLRNADLRGAKLEGAVFTAAKVHGVKIDPQAAAIFKADWVDFGPAGDGKEVVRGAQIADALLGGIRTKKPVAPDDSPARRYFGKGDVMSDATLAFGENARIEIESRFERCTISLGSGSEMVIAEEGVLSECRILGQGTLIVHGYFGQGDEPGISDLATLLVTSKGVVVSTVQQGEVPTRFGFEPGSRLRLKIKEPKSKKK